MALNTKQKILLDLLVRAEKIMRENDIKFFLFGGSTIGALRHDGFIPWDDDIDIIIDAENFYKLKELFKDGPIDNIELVYFHNDPYWYRTYAMLVNQTDTCYSRPCMYTTGKNAGTRIDTMICDYVPTDRLEEYKHDLMLYQDVMMESSILDQNIYKLKDEYFAMKKREDEIGKLALEKEFRDKLESYACPEADQIVVRYSTRKMRHYDIDTIYEPLYHDFEGYMMPLPAKPQKQLRAQYGYDWYIIPQQDAYGTHMFFNNYEISGNNYHDDISRFYDRDELEKAARNKKAIRIDRFHYMVERRELLDNIVTQKEIMRLDLENRQEEFVKLLDNNEFRQIYSMMNPLLKILDSVTSVEKEHKRLPKKVMKGWLRSCFACGKYYKADKVIAAFELSDDPSYADECDLLERIKSLAEAYQDEDVELMALRLQSFTDVEKTIIPDCILTKIRLNKDESGHFSKTEELISDCDAYLNKVKNNYEVIKAKADILYECGSREEAMDLYKTVHKKTDNGLDLRDIEKRFGLGPRFKGLVEEDEIDRMLRDVLA